MIITHDENGLVIDGHRLFPAEVAALVRRINRIDAIQSGFMDPAVVIGERRIWSWEDDYRVLVQYLNDIQVVPR